MLFLIVTFALVLLVCSGIIVYFAIQSLATTTPKATISDQKKKCCQGHCKSSKTNSDIPPQARYDYTSDYTPPVMASTADDWFTTPTPPIYLGPPVQVNLDFGTSNATPIISDSVQYAPEPEPASYSAPEPIAEVTSSFDFGIVSDNSSSYDSSSSFDSSSSDCGSFDCSGGDF